MSLSFKDFHAFIYTSPPGSAFFNAVEQGWDTTAYLVAGLVDLNAILAWQNTTDAQEKFPKHRPKPLPRPDRGGKESPETARIMSGMGGIPASVMPVEEFHRRIQERRAARGN